MPIRVLQLLQQILISRLLMKLLVQVRQELQRRLRGLLLLLQQRITTHVIVGEGLLSYLRVGLVGIGCIMAQLCA